MPVSETSARPEKPKSNGIRIIYCGGLQKWQRAEDMLDAAEACSLKNTAFEFCVNDEDAFKILLSERKISKPVTYGRKQGAALRRALLAADFGFLLREDSPVNRVAFPTKLIEYIQNGVIPILDFEDIGDMPAYGIQYITLGDFVSGKIPDAENRAGMITRNLEILRNIESDRAAALKELKEWIESPDAE